MGLWAFDASSLNLIIHECTFELNVTFLFKTAVFLEMQILMLVIFPFILMNGSL